jgi:hypothetical protein
MGNHQKHFIAVLDPRTLSANSSLFLPYDLRNAEENSQGMTPADFIAQYEAALATQDWSEVSPLIYVDASVTFSDGSVHKGKEAVRAAFERNFRSIAGEKYRISNVHWLLRSNDAAVYMFDFDWIVRLWPIGALLWE